MLLLLLLQLKLLETEDVTWRGGQGVRGDLGKGDSLKGRKGYGQDVVLQFMGESAAPLTLFGVEVGETTLILFCGARHCLNHTATAYHLKQTPRGEGVIRIITMG